MDPIAVACVGLVCLIFATVVEHTKRVKRIEETLNRWQIAPCDCERRRTQEERADWIHRSHRELEIGAWNDPTRLPRITATERRCLPPTR